MPETQNPPAEGQQGDPKEGTGAEAPKPDKTFTQTDVDRIVADRLARERAQYSDYDELKAAAQKLREAEDAKKDELTKVREAEARARQEADEARATASATMRRAAILTEAARLDAIDPEMVVAALVANDTITVQKDGSVKGAKEAVEQLLKDKPFLAKNQTPGTSGGQFGGNDPTPASEQIRQLEEKGDYDAARRMKIASWFNK